MGTPKKFDASRRTFFITSGAVTAMAATPLVGCAGRETTRAEAKIARPRWIFFREEEATVVEAVVDTFLPKDDVGPGAVELGVVAFIDRRLESGYGIGSGLYVSGPFGEGVAGQGTQSALTPREKWRIGIESLQSASKGASGKGFEELPYSQRNAMLLNIRSGKLNFSPIPATVWLAQALNDTVEGYFCDPIHGGNADMGSWKMLGFPGPFRIYSTEIDANRGRVYVDAPRGIADLT